MNKAPLKIASFLVVAASVLSLSACKVEKTDSGELPKVEVDAKGGDLPNYDVQTADVDVGTQPATVPVPDVDVDVKTKQATVPVPDVDITMPSEQEKSTTEQPKQ